ncbi:MAG: phosphorylase [Methyloglobulus sp.]|nr:phosphorylase [Methyloglobulus sp.]
MSIGIVVALPEELSTLTTKRLAKGYIESLADNILVVYSGAGAEHAYAAAELLVKQGATCLFSWGCAAALISAFQPGDLVLANRCVDANQKQIGLSSDDDLLHIKQGLLKYLSVPIHIGKLAESKHIVASSVEKAQIAAATGVIALDMESAAIAKVAELHGIPFLAVRAIADPLDMNLPKAVSYALNNQGEVVLSKLIAYLLGHPAELPGLIKLGLHFHRAKKTLKRVAAELDKIIPSLKVVA